MYTEDTFDRYQNDKQAPKAALMLKVNAREVKIQSLIVKLMQRLQIEADRLHSRRCMKKKPRSLPKTLGLEKSPTHDDQTHYDDSGAKKRPKILFPFPSIFRSLRDPFRPVLKTRACTTERIPNRLARTPRRACDGITDASPSSSCHSTHCAGDTADCISKCGGDEFGGSGDAFVLI
ncbi:unnamed protein product [Penicillium viridicatum]